MHLAPLIANAGFRPLAYSISVGNPPGSTAEIQDRLNRIAPSLRLCQQLGGGWSYHSYSLPYGTNLAEEIWYSLRYRQYYSYFASAHPDLVNLPLVLTEGGIDGAGPWSTRGDATKYQNWLAWFDSEIRKDNYCLGVTLFQIGDTGGWGGFNVEPVAGWIASHLSANPGTSAPPAVLRCLRETTNTLTLHLSAVPHPMTATNPANYRVRLGGTNALAVLSAAITNGTNILLVTAAPDSASDYLVAVSNLVHSSAAPGASFLNGQTPVRVAIPLALISANTTWRYEQRGVDLGTSWRGRTFNDATWPLGMPLFAYETGALPDPIRTPLTTNQGKMTFYFRKPFTLPGGATNALLRLRTVLDDGALFHCNGAELWRLGMPVGAVDYNSPAARTVDNGVSEGPFFLTPTNLVAGTNVLAVEVHQINGTSSDVTFGTAIEALVLPSQAAGSFRLSGSVNGQQLLLNWDQPATLETASSATGAWQAAAQQLSPVTVPMTNSRSFFRLRR